MSTIYNNPGYGDGDYTPPRRVNFGWISESWSLFSANAGTWVLATLSFLVPSIILGIISGFTQSSSSLDSPSSSSPSPGGIVLILLGEVVAGLITIFLCGGIYRMAVKQVRGLPISPGDILSGGPVFLRMLGFGLLFMLIIIGLEIVCFAPMLLLIGSTAHGVTPSARPETLLPVIMAGLGWFVLALLAFMFFSVVFFGLLLPGYAMIADGAGVGAAFSGSFQAMKKNWLSAAGFVFVIYLLILVSEIPCGLGLLVTLPMFFLISALAYRDMVGIPGWTPPSPQPYYGATQAGTWPPPPATGQATPPVYGQPPPAYGQPPPPTTPSFGQPPSYGAPPTRTSLSGDEIDDQGNVIRSGDNPPDRPNSPPPVG